ncbi:hypothetical protein E2I00_015206 [Balaenoptera physalus]|uniref:Uncharacterized protein n=1 Tax=Balaenoptera physalus TaxID=9770 RepID=A0A6A1QF12_BALPH|nr:hypothetical protein E2I00_015206 [Balaenoptera physalus]
MRQAGSTLSKAEPSWDGVSSWAAAPSRKRRLGSDKPPLGHQVSAPNPSGLSVLECTGCPKCDPGLQVDATGQIHLSFPVPVPLLPHSSLAAQPSCSQPSRLPTLLQRHPRPQQPWEDPAGIIKTPGGAYKETSRPSKAKINKMSHDLSSKINYSSPIGGQSILKQRLPRHIQPRANTHGSAANVNNGLKKLQQTLVVSGESLGYWQLLVFLTHGPGTHMVGPRVSDENQHINTAGCDGTFKGDDASGSVSFSEETTSRTALGNGLQERNAANGRCTEDTHS